MEELSDEYVDVRYHPSARTNHTVDAAMMPDAGIVTIQAITMLPAIPHRTAEVRRAAPTPIIAPVMVWVVDTGTPSPVAMNKVIAPPVSAQNPCTGVRRVIFDPIVWTIRHPPINVPNPIAA